MSAGDQERARLAYEAYASILCTPQLGWAELPPWVREAWAAAIKAVDQRDEKPTDLPAGRVYREDG